MALNWKTRCRRANRAMLPSLQVLGETRSGKRTRVPASCPRQSESHTFVQSMIWFGQLITCRQNLRTMAQLFQETPLPNTLFLSSHAVLQTKDAAERVADSCSPSQMAVPKWLPPALILLISIGKTTDQPGTSMAPDGHWIRLACRAADWLWLVTASSQSYRTSSTSS